MTKLPAISGKEAIRGFEKAGWCIEHRAKSRHIIMKKGRYKNYPIYPGT